MNLIDFHVTETISEEYGKVYELYGYEKLDADNEPKEWWKEFLLSDGIKQTYKYWDDGGIRIKTDVMKVNDKYYVGYIGQH